jgi:hypothetical protein
MNEAENNEANIRNKLNTKLSNYFIFFKKNGAMIKPIPIK